MISIVDIGEQNKNIFCFVLVSAVACRVCLVAWLHRPWIIRPATLMMNPPFAAARQSQMQSLFFAR